jgi:hypothetical protein
LSKPQVGTNALACPHLKYGPNCNENNIKKQSAILLTRKEPGGHLYLMMPWYEKKLGRMDKKIRQQVANTVRSSTHLQL